MSIEERAEQYLETKFSYGDAITMTEYSKKDIAKQAYIAGYNEAQNTITQCNRSALSGVKWHKVADGDLPEECTDVLAINILDNGNPSEPILFHFVTSDTWEWLPRRIACLSNKQILAWCEIPHYE